MRDRECTGLSKKIPAKFSDTCSVRADGLCIGCPKLVGSRKVGKLKHAGIILLHAVPPIQFRWPNEMSCWSWWYQVLLCVTVMGQKNFLNDGRRLLTAFPVQMQMGRAQRPSILSRARVAEGGTTTCPWLNIDGGSFGPSGGPLRLSFSSLSSSPCFLWMLNPLRDGETSCRIGEMKSCSG